MAGQFYGELAEAMPEWKGRLGDDPSRLAELERNALLTPKIVKFLTKSSDQRERAILFRAVARIGWRPCRHVHDAFGRGADLVVAGLIALAMKQPAFEEACESSRVASGISQPRPSPLTEPYVRVRIRLLFQLTSANPSAGTPSGIRPPTVAYHNQDAHTRLSNAGEQPLLNPNCVSS
jgi:hypothetical protein